MLEAAIITASDDLLEQWIVSKPCQTTPLLENLIRRFESDATARVILVRLAAARSILATLTQSYPEAFDTLCRDAVSSIKHNSDRVVHASIVQEASLTALPSFESYVELVAAIVSRSNETPEQWLPRVHRILASASPRLLSCLPERTVQSALESWREQLRSSNPLNALVALDVACNLRKCVPNALESSFGSPMHLSVTLRQWIEKCSALFEGDKGHSIVETTILTTLRLCSDEGPHFGALVELLQIAEGVLQQVQEPVLYEWVKTHQSVIKKLAQKLSRRAVPSQISVTCIGVIAILDKRFELEEWPILIANGVRYITACDDTNALLGGTTIKTSVKVLLESLDNLARRIAGKGISDSSTSETTRALARFLLEDCRPGRSLSVNDGLNVQVAETLVDHLVSLNRRQDSPLAEAMVQVLDEAALPEWWCLDLGTSGMLENCGALSVCSRDHENRRQRLCTDVSLLMVAISSTSSATMSRQNFGIIRQRLSYEPSTVRHTPCQYPQPMSPYSGGDTVPSAPGSSCNWQEELKSRLAESSKHTASHVERFVCELTKDLQARCDHVEEPLRHARAKAEDLQTSLDRTKQALQEARNSCDQSKQALDSTTNVLAQTNFRQQETLDSLFSLRQLYEESQSELSNVQEAMARQQPEFRQEAEELQARGLAERTELQRVHELRAADFEEQLAELHASVSSLKDEIRWLRDEMKRTQEEADSHYQQQVIQLQEEAQTMQEEARKHADELETRISTIQDESQQLHTELRQREAEAQGLERSNGDIEAQLGNVNRDLRSSRDEAAELRASLIQEQNKARDLRQDKESLTAQQRQQEHRVAELEASEKSWQEQCKAQEKALKKARKTEQSVLAIFQKPPTSTSSPIASRASTVTATATPTPRLPEGSFVSEDDKDYSELIKLGKGA